MEDLMAIAIEFANLGNGNGNGNGSGYGFGNGFGNGNGNGNGSGYGNGSGNGLSDGNGSSKGYGNGYGNDYGNGSSKGYSFGYSYSCGIGFGIKSVNGFPVVEIDKTPTAIYQIRGNIAKGATFKTQTQLDDCFVVKDGDFFAHGKTLHDAYSALQEKIMEERPIEERIEAFRKEFSDFGNKYPAKELYKWHHILTGSCKFGRDQFCEAHSIDIERDEYTVNEFIALVETSYGGSIISKLKRK